MPKGRIPKAHELKAIEGGLAAKRKANPKKVYARWKRIEAPDYLDEIATKEFRRVVRELQKRDQYSTLFRSVLADYAHAYSLGLKAAEKVAELGEVIETPSGYLKQNPWQAICDKCFDQRRKIETELGLTPLSQVRLQGAKLGDIEDQANAGKKTAGNPWDTF